MTTSVDKITFTSPINIDNSYTNVYQGHHESTMELFPADEDGNCCIEWEVDAIGANEGIGIFCSDGGKVVTDYDGVFEVPYQAIRLLERNGYDVTYLTENFNKEEQAAYDAVTIGPNEANNELK